MNSLRLPVTLLATALFVSACADMPPLFLPHEDDKPAYARTTSAAGQAAAREPLEVPPELRAEIELPGAAEVGARADENILPARYQEAVAGKAVALDARLYELSPAEVFSAAVDAMTSLNIPVEAVDSPSGIVTSDWIRKGADNPNLFAGLNLFGGGTAYTRHRFIVRVFRTTLEGKAVTRLEVRTLGQAFENKHWVNRPIKRRVADELFAAVDEQLTRMQATTLPLQPAE